MAFRVTWDTAYEAIPAGTESVSLGDDRIREFKIDTRERLEIDHSMVGDADDGKHVQVTLMEQASDPITVANEGFLYTKDVGGVTDLFYKNSAGDVIPLTKAAAAQSFPAGTVMCFYQAAAPTGWTKSTAVNDKVIRVVSGGTGGSTGGSWTITGVTVDSHTLVESEIPAHNHGITDPGHAHSLPTNPAASGNYFGEAATSGTASNTNANTTGITINNTGGGGGHTHGLTSDAAWRPAYADVILATKD